MRLTLLPSASDWRLGGRATAGVLARAEPGFDEDATEDGLPATDRLPDCKVDRLDFGDEEDGDGLWARLARCCAGSLALIASANAREAYSASGSRAG